MAYHKQSRATPEVTHNVDHSDQGKQEGFVKKT